MQIMQQPCKKKQLAAKAPLSSLTFTGNVSGITKSMVGLNNVDTTADLNKPIATATQSAFGLKAPIASPTFTRTRTAPIVNLSSLVYTDTSGLDKLIFKGA